MPIKKEDYWIRPKKRMLEYQVRIFERELNKEKKAYEKLLAGQEERAKQRGAKFKSVEELNEAYIKGLVDEKEMGWQKVAIWNAYDDHDHPARIKWLEAEYAKYKRRLDYLIQYIDERREASRKKYWSYFRKYNKRGKYQRGYLTDRSVTQVIARLFGIKQFAATGKLMGYTRWTFEESFVIASYFQMTPKEYADTFLKGLFREDREGHFVCKVDDPGRLLRERTEKILKGVIGMEKTRFIVAKIGDGYSTEYYWKINFIGNLNIGDFAIVENKDSFAMVEVLGIGETLKKYEHNLVGHHGGIFKNVIGTISREELEKQRDRKKKLDSTETIPW